MSVDYTATALLEDIRLRAMLPDDAALSDANLLRLANGELQTYILPILLRVNEEYLVTYADIPLVAGTAGYSIPSRAIGSKVRDVQILDGNNYRSLSRLEPEHAELHTSESGDPFAFMFRGHEVVLVPAPASAGTLRVYYYRRPNALTTMFTTTTGSILSPSVENPTSNMIGVESTTGFSDGDHVDIALSEPPFNIIHEDKEVDNANSTHLYTEEILEAVAAGGYVTLTGYSAVPQIPVELHPLLSQRVAVRVLQALGDPKVGEAKKLCDEMREEAVKLLTPRSEGTGRKIINFNGPGWHRGTRTRFRS